MLDESFNQPNSKESFQPVNDGKVVSVNRKSKPPLMLLAALSLVVLLLCGGYYIYKIKVAKVDMVSSNINASPATSVQNANSSKETVTLKLGVGYQIDLEKSWDVEIGEYGKLHNFATVTVPNSRTRLEIEAYSHNLPNWEKYISNQLYQLNSAGIKSINGNIVQVQNGHEKFGSSNANLLVGRWDGDSQTFLLRVIGNDQTTLNNIFAQLSSSVVPPIKNTSSIRLINKAFAAENDIPANLPQVNYKPIEVMGPLFQDTITKDDQAYKDGFIKGYSFTAFKGQRLTAVAYEKDEASVGSYVASQIYGANGNNISEESGTRVEFEAPVTGTYYYVVRSMYGRVGGIDVGVDDRSQTQAQDFIKYPDGAELFQDNSKIGDILVGNYEVGLIVQIPKPVTVNPDNTLEYEYIVPEFGPNLGTVTSRLTVYMAPDLLKFRGLGEDVGITMLDDQKYVTDISIMQLGLNRILVTPKTGLFPKGYHVMISETLIKTPNPKVTMGYIGGGFFTQDKKNVSPPIMTQLKNDFSDKFYDITESYINWFALNTSATEVSGAYLEGRGWDQSSINLFRDYFVNKGYSIDQLNSNASVSAVLKGNTVCKIRESYTCDSFMCGNGVYCGNLK